MGFLNFGYNFGANSWLFPSFRPIFYQSPWNFFSSIQFPLFNIFGDYNTQPINIDTYERSEVSKINAPAVKTPGTENEAKKVEVKKTVPVKKTNKSYSDNNIKQKADNLKIIGYSLEAGERLAKTALKKAVGWTGYCAIYVKNAIKEAGLGASGSGHAFQMVKILRKNCNFRELSSYQIDVNKLPAGCILVYGKGVGGYSSQYGHVEITTGDGRAVSDGITRSVHKKPTAIFVPVEQNNLA